MIKNYMFVLKTVKPFVSFIRKNKVQFNTSVLLSESRLLSYIQIVESCKNLSSYVNKYYFNVENILSSMRTPK